MAEDMSMKAVAERFLEAKKELTETRERIEGQKKTLSAELRAIQKTVSKLESTLVKAMEECEFAEVRLGNNILQKRYYRHDLKGEIGVLYVPSLD